MLNYFEITQNTQWNEEKNGKTHKRSYTNFELSSLNDSQGPETTSIYSVKGHLNSSDSIYKVQ